MQHEKIMYNETNSQSALACFFVYFILFLKAIELDNLQF